MTREKLGREAPDKVFNARFMILLIINASMYLGLMTANTLVSKYANTLTVSSILIGATTSAMAITCLALKLVAAPIMNCFPKKYILMLALFLMGIAFAGVGLSDSIGAVCFFRGLQGIGLAFASTCFLTLASDALPDDKLTSGIGYFSLAQAVAQAVGPSVGLWLIDRIGYRRTFLLVAGLLVLSGIGILLFVRLTLATEKKPFRFTINDIIAKEALLPALFMLVVTMVFYVINTFLVLFAEERNVNNIGIFFTVYSVTILFTRPVIGRLADKLGTVKVLIPSLCCFMLSFVIISCSHDLWGFLLAAFIQAFGYGVATPLIQALIMKSVVKERRSVASCTGYLGTDIGTLLGPVLGGMLVERFGYFSMWNLMTIPLALMIVIVLVFRSVIDRIDGHDNG